MRKDKEFIQGREILVLNYLTVMLKLNSFAFKNYFERKNKYF